jgi:hypothetical protein
MRIRIELTYSQLRSSDFGVSTATLFEAHS